MARIKIKDLPEDHSISKQEMKMVLGGTDSERQVYQTMFQNFDQKSNQMYNLLSSVMKAMNEMEMSPVRNML